MARYAITTATPHGETLPQVVRGPEISIAEHKQEFRQLAASSTHPEYSEVQLWESDAGIVRKIRLRPPAAERKKSEPAPKGADKKTKTNAPSKADTGKK